MPIKKYGLSMMRGSVAGNNGLAATLKKRLGEIGGGNKPATSNTFTPAYYQSSGKPGGNVNYLAHPDLAALRGTSIASGKLGNTIYANGETGDSLTNLTDQQVKNITSGLVNKYASNFWKKRAAAGRLRDTFYITKGLDGSPASEWQAHPNVPALNGFRIKGSGDKYTLIYNDKELEQFKNVPLEDINNTVNSLVNQYVAKVQKKQPPNQQILVSK